MEASKWIWDPHHTAHEGILLRIISMSKDNIVDMGIGNILLTGLFAEECKIWYRWQQNNKTLPAFKMFGQVKTFTTMTAGQIGSGMNAQEEEEVDKEEYDNACNNMAQAYLAQQTAMINVLNNSDRTDLIQQQLNSMTQKF